MSDMLTDSKPVSSHISQPSSTEEMMPAEEIPVLSSPITDPGTGQDAIVLASPDKEDMHTPLEQNENGKTAVRDDVQAVETSPVVQEIEQDDIILPDTPVEMEEHFSEEGEPEAVAEEESQIQGHEQSQLETDEQEQPAEVASKIEESAEEQPLDKDPVVTETYGAEPDAEEESERQEHEIEQPSAERLVTISTPIDKEREVEDREKVLTEEKTEAGQENARIEGATQETEQMQADVVAKPEQVGIEETIPEEEHVQAEIEDTQKDVVAEEGLPEAEPAQAQSIEDQQEAGQKEESDEEAETGKEQEETGVEAATGSEGKAEATVREESAGAEEEQAEERTPLPASKRWTVPLVGLFTRKQPISRRQRVISLTLLGIVLAGVLIPGIFAVSYGIRAYSTYTTLHDHAYGGVRHLLNVKDIFTGLKTHPTGFLDVTKLHRSQKEFVAAHDDFRQVVYTLDHTDIISTVTTYLPQYGPQITSARAASEIGMDVADIGTMLANTGITLAPHFRGPLLTDSHEPLVTASMLNLVHTTITNLLPKLTDIQQRSHSLSLNALPLSSSQRDQIGPLLQALPQAVSDLKQADELLGVAGWLLGVDQPRTFLVQTMDRAELRPSGGFTGQYGELQISGGRMAPFSLHDISFIEYVDNSPTLGQQALPQYRSWWPFANWGLRDSNLSADFPTTAQIAIQQYKHEVGHQVDGVIQFTPFLIEHVLEVIGPIQIPSYHETITATNLEDKLHYYQQDNSGIRKQEIVQGVNPPAEARKLFTGLLAHLLMEHVRHAPPDEILAIGREMLHDLKTKDLQVYLTNPQAENLLEQYGYAAQMDRSTTHDGLYVVQANVSASKASQFVRTLLHDTVTLDAQGGATHLMQLQLVYNQSGPVYGYDTYRDYVRVYVPPTSQYLWGDGFDTGTPLCGGTYVACPQSGVYPHDELVCPPGQYQPGAAAPSDIDPDGARWLPLDTIGGPTNRSSDEPGRAMYGGWVVVPKNCSMTVTLSWYVPPMGKSPYTLLIQRQAGTFPEVDLTILPSPESCSVLKTTVTYFHGTLTEDSSFGLKPSHALPRTVTSCYPQPPV